jgi:hypothetical protein
MLCFYRPKGISLVFWPVSPFFWSCLSTSLLPLIMSTGVPLCSSANHASMIALFALTCAAYPVTSTSKSIIIVSEVVANGCPQKPLQLQVWLEMIHHHLQVEIRCSASHKDFWCTPMNGSREITVEWPEICRASENMVSRCPLHLQAF